MYAACCRYLYKSNSPGVQDYLCNRLYGLPEAGVERYLSQICQLVISRPFGSLERVLAALCASSLRIAVKVEMHSMISMHQAQCMRSCTCSRGSELHHSRCISAQWKQLFSEWLCRYIGCCQQLRRISPRTRLSGSCVIIVNELRWRALGYSNCRISCISIGLQSNVFSSMLCE